MTLTIDFFILGFKHPYLNAWFGGMYHSFFEALEEAGCHVTYSSQKPNMEADVLVVQMGGIKIGPMRRLCKPSKDQWF